MVKLILSYLTIATLTLGISVDLTLAKPQSSTLFPTKAGLKIFVPLNKAVGDTSVPITSTSRSANASSAPAFRPIEPLIRSTPLNNFENGFPAREKPVEVSGEQNFHPDPGFSTFPGK
jgi:hypothetical protein